MGKVQISVKMQKEWYGSRIGCVFPTSPRFRNWSLRKPMRQHILYTLVVRRCPRPKEEIMVVWYEERDSRVCG
jgi:hypothetical protein